MVSSHSAQNLYLHQSTLSDWAVLPGHSAEFMGIFARSGPDLLSHEDGNWGLSVLLLECSTPLRRVKSTGRKRFLAAIPRVCHERKDAPDPPECRQVLPYLPMCSLSQEVGLPSVRPVESILLGPEHRKLNGMQNTHKSHRHRERNNNAICWILWQECFRKHLEP